MTTIYTLRVRKGLVGGTFPFDRIYLVKFSERAVIDQMWRYALVMPVDQLLKGMLRQCFPVEIRDRPFNRDEAAEVNRTPEPGEWHALLDSEQWIMVVPVLGKVIKRHVEMMDKAPPKIEDEVTPKYLVSPKWYSPRREKTRNKNSKHVVQKTPFPAYTYLQTPTRKIRPVCVVCPRYILHQNGECQVGQQVCYEALPIGLKEDFQEAPEPSTNINEPETEKFIHGDVPENHTGTD